MALAQKKQGFTLVELAIVIVIIGLIVAGVVAGQKLVRQAQLRAVLADLNTYSIAIKSFQLQYDALPGDMVNAYSLLSNGSDTVCGTQTLCDGDGNKQIAYTTSLTDNEALRAWQHLTAAGLIKGSFTGTASSAGSAMALCQAKVNVPAGPLSNTVFIFHYWGGGLANNTINLFEGTLDPTGCGNALLGHEPLNPIELSTIDIKIDDGLPRKGKLWAGGNSGASNCYSGTSYNMSLSDMVCWFHYIF